MSVPDHERKARPGQAPAVWVRHAGLGAGGAVENSLQNAPLAMANPIFNVGLGVSPVLVGFAMAFPRIWELLLDPFIGTASDRTTSRLGRRLPYIIPGLLASFLLFAAMWWAPAGWSRETLGAWLNLNGEAIYATRPWKTFGEGPSATNNKNGQGDAETDTFTPEDIRFTQSKDGKTLYAIVLEIPKDGKVAIKSLANSSPNRPGKIGSVRLLGGGELKFTRDESGLHVLLPENFTGQTALALKITS